MKIIAKIRSLIGREEERKKEEVKPTEKPYFIYAYLNGQEITRFSSQTQSLKTLSQMLRLFSLYRDYTIEYNISARKVKVYFAAKKSDTDKMPEEKKKEGKKK